MHGRPRPSKNQPEDPEKQKAANKRVRCLSVTIVAQINKACSKASDLLIQILAQQH